MEKTTHELRKDDKEYKYTIGVDIKNSPDLVKMGKLVEKKIAVSLQRYYNEKVHFKSKEKLD